MVDPVPAAVPAPVAVLAPSVVVAVAAPEAAGEESAADSTPDTEPENVAAELANSYYREWMEAKDCYSEATKEISQMQDLVAKFQRALLRAEQVVEEKKEEVKAAVEQQEVADARVIGEHCYNLLYGLSD